MLHVACYMLVACCMSVACMHVKLHACMSRHCMSSCMSSCMLSWHAMHKPSLKGELSCKVESQVKFLIRVEL
jgi:hypothetical protein